MQTFAILIFVTLIETLVKIIRKKTKIKMFD